MPKIIVATPFSLTTASGAIDFPAGVHEVDEDVANHWYVKAHSETQEAEEPAAPRRGRPPLNKTEN